MKVLAKTTAIFALLLASTSTMAGGCLQGTWTYYDDEGSYTGYETVGCGAADGLRGERAYNSRFTQGCNATPI